MKSNPTRKIKQGICAYCGAVGEVTSDHIVPRCLWSESIPQDIPIVNACRACNQIEKSGNDVYLRDLLINDPDALQSPLVLKPWEKHLRAVSRNQSEMDRDRRNHGKTLMTRRPSGLIMPYFVVEVAKKRTRDIMSLMVRGLHYYYLREPLPKDTLFHMGRLQTTEQIEAISNDIAGFTGEYHRGASVSIGDGAVFSCEYVEMFRDDHTTLWRLNFYGNVVFGVMTNPVVITHSS